MDAAKTKQPFNPWPWSIAAVFGVAFVAAIVWVLFCIFNGQDLVASDYYEREVMHQEQMDRAQRGLALGSHASVAFDPNAQTIMVRVPVEQAASKPVGRIELYRPSEAGLDQTLPLNVGADGRQPVGVSELKPGLWHVRVSWTVEGEEHYLEEKLNLGGASAE